MRKGTTRSRLSIILIIYIITIIPLASYGIQKINFVSAASGTPILYSPANGAEISDSTPTLDWSTVADTVWTQIDVDEFSSFFSPSTQKFMGSASTIDWPTALASGVWYWRVRVTDDIDQLTWGTWSTVWSFEVDTTAPSAPSLVAPTNGGVTPDSTPYFDWGSVTDGVLYEIEVDTDTGFGASCVIDTTTGSNTYYNTPSALSDDTYYWHVRAQDTFSRWGSWSSIWSVIIDSTVPAAPTLVSPSDGSGSADNTPALDWSTPTYATQYEVEVNTQSNFLGTMVVDTIVASVSQYTCPALSDDDYYWRVRAGNILSHFGSWSSTWSFTVAYNDPAAPTLLSPSDGSGSADNTPTLDWSDPTYAVYYDLQVNTQSNFLGTMVVDTTLTSTSIYTCTTLSDDTYYWRVRAANAISSYGDWSSTWSFTVAFNDPAVPTLISPADDSGLTDNTPTLDWNDPTYAVYYHLQVNTQADFLGTMVVNTTLVSTSQYTCSTLSDDDYYWRVRAANVLESYGTWSAAWSFTVAFNDAGIPTLISPGDGSAFTDNTPDLDWSEPTYSVYYHLQVNTQANFLGTMEVNTTLTSISQYTCSTLSDDTYYWRVRAANALESYDAWSSVWSFTVAYNDPAAPILTSPTDGLTSSDTTPTLTWSSVYQGVNYQVQVINGGTVVDTTTTNLYYTCPALAEGNYQWRVRAQNAVGTWGSYSAYYDYTVDTTGPTISTIFHEPSTPVDGIPVSINCTVTDLSGILYMRLYYRINSGSWLDDLMSSSAADNYTYSIGIFNYNDFVEYYFVATDDSPNNFITIDNNGGSFYSFTVGSADIEGPIISSVTHSPISPIQTDEITVDATVTDNYGVNFVYIYYRLDFGDWSQHTMINTAGTLYQFSFGPFLEHVDFVEFYIYSEDISPLANNVTDDNSGIYYQILINHVDSISPGISTIVHSPDTPTDKQNVTISCNVVDQTGIDSVVLYYRINNGTWLSVEMDYTFGDVYVVHLVAFEGNSIIEYYIQATDSSSLHNVGIDDNNGNYYSFTVTEITYAGSLNTILPIITALSLLLFVDIRRRK